MIPAKSKRQLAQVIPFGIITMLFGIVYSLIEKGILGEHSMDCASGNKRFNHIRVFVNSVSSKKNISAERHVLLRLRGAVKTTCRFANNSMANIRYFHFDNSVS